MLPLVFVLLGSLDTVGLLGLLAVTQADLVYPEILWTCLMCSVSLSTSSLIEHIVLHRWFNVLTTPYLCWRSWLLSNCKYWSLCFFFRYTEKLSAPVGSLVILASKIGMVFCSSSSLVNLMAGCMLLMWLESSSMSASLRATKVSSTLSSPQSDFVYEWLYGGFLEPLHKQIVYYWAHRGAHSCSLNLGINLFVELKVCCLKTNFQQICDMFWC